MAERVIFQVIRPSGVMVAAFITNRYTAYWQLQQPDSQRLRRRFSSLLAWIITTASWIINEYHKKADHMCVLIYCCISPCIRHPTCTFIDLHLRRASGTFSREAFTESHQSQKILFWRFSEYCHGHFVLLIFLLPPRVIIRTSRNIITNKQVTTNVPCLMMSR